VVPCRLAYSSVVLHLGVLPQVYGEGSKILVIKIPWGLGFILSDVGVILSVILSDGVVTERDCDTRTLRGFFTLDLTFLTFYSSVGMHVSLALLIHIHKLTLK
jgi:hypothetical protein